MSCSRHFPKPWGSPCGASSETPVVRKFASVVGVGPVVLRIEHARALYALGVTDAVPETIEASLQLSEAVLVDLGVPMGLVIASIHEKRDEFRKLLAVAGAPERPRSTRGPRRG